jgi:hypothetical protein
MKRTSIGLLLLASLITFASFVVVQAWDYGVVSSNLWTVTDATGNALGKAQTVCLDAATAPSSCPAGAESYGFTPGTAWSADLSSIPGAKWIWAPNVTGATTGAANKEFTFETVFYLCDVPQEGGTISVAADDSAEVFLNYATTPILTSTGFSALSTVPVPASSLTRGVNNIQVKVKNAPGCASDEYRCNPAGFVFGGTFKDGLSALPTCPGSPRVEVGTSETVSCPAPTSGLASRVCICPPPPAPVIGIWSPVDYSTCVTTPPPVTPPVTCTGSDGTTRIAAGTSEMLSCPAGLEGSLSRTCQATGSWGSVTGTCTPPTPPVVCAGCICGGEDKTPPILATCPGGTVCGPRSSPPPPRPDWCAAFFVAKAISFWFFLPTPSECAPVGTLSTDWFCDAGP